MKTPLEISNQYADDILSGKIPSGPYVKKACERYISFFDKYEFREDILHRVIDFIGHFKHFQGKHKGKPFTLEPWQVFSVANIFCWYEPNSSKRVTENVYIQMARKQGKTAFIAAIGLYCLVADGEAGAEVDCLANSVKQAHLLFDMSKHFAGDLDKKHKHFVKLRDTLKFSKTDSLMQIQASESANLDGFNPSCYILDEVHSYPDSKLYDVMRSGQGMRENPLGILITTAGFSLTGFCFNHRKMCIDILYGLTEDDSQFSLIYEMDENDDWEDQNNWIKSNPNIDITVSRKFLQTEVNRCKNNAALKQSVLTKNFDVWLADAIDTWISDQKIVNASMDISWEFFKDRITFVGIDLSSVSDLTCATFMTKDLDTGVYYFKTKYYLPEVTVMNHQNAEQYQQWANMGYLTVTPGNCTDYDYILLDILNIQKLDVIIDSIGFDTYNATQFQINATASGLKMEPFAQSLSSFNRPTKEFERLVLQGKIRIDNNPITRWCFANAVLKTDYSENVKPIKRGGINTENANKIDGTITHIEALGTYLESPTAKYEKSDVTV